MVKGIPFIVVGEFLYQHYEKDFVESLRHNGETVVEFNIWKKASFMRKLLKIEYYFSFPGIVSYVVYIKLILLLRRFRSQGVHVFFWRPTLINPRIIGIIRSYMTAESMLLSYNNDNPFSSSYKTASSIYQRRLWKGFIKTIPLFDISFIYRPSNYQEYMKAGARKVFVFPPGFPDKLIGRFDYELTDFDVDIVFIGYFEQRRADYVNALIEKGYDVKIFGTGWDDKLSKNYHYGKVVPVYNEKYYSTLNRARICLCFLSTLNDDVYTRRNFEIPASKAVMLSERTNELLDFFVEGDEAFFFSSKAELLEKVQMLIGNDVLIHTVRENAYKRSLSSGYSLDCRVGTLIDQLESADDMTITPKN